jgi:hypothetical protein
VNDLIAREQLRLELTRLLEYRRSEYLRLKDARTHITSGELGEALAGYEHALETVAQFPHDLEDTAAAS